MEELGDGFELVLGGRFLTPEYERLVRGMPGFRRVRELGFVAQDEVWTWYSRSDAGLVCLAPLPRFRESLPVKLFEYMAAGLPVIASDFPLFRDIVESSGCGVCVNPQNPVDIAWAVRSLAADRARCREMAEAGPVAVREKYNWEAEARTLLLVYGRLVAGGASRRRLVCEAIEGQGAGDIRNRAGTATVFRGRKAVAVPIPAGMGELRVDG